MSSLIINNSTTRFIRAGRTNMVWPVFAIGLFIFINALTLPGIARIAVGGFLLLTLLIGLQMYVTTLARIVFLEDRVQIVLATYEREIAYDMIESVRISKLSLTPLLKVRIKPKSIGHTIRFTIPGPLTPWGSLIECSAKLVEEFRLRGVRGVER